MAAPVCNLQPPQPAFDTNVPTLPVIPLVSINPQNWNIPQSLTQQLQMMANAINTMKQVIEAITNRGAPPNNFGGNPSFQGGGGGGGGPTAGGARFPNSPQQKTRQPQQQKQQKKQGAGFVEVGRSSETVRIFNPDDNTQYVDVEQIVSLTMRDPVSGLQWKWRR